MKYIVAILLVGTLGACGNIADGPGRHTNSEAALEKFEATYAANHPSTPPSDAPVAQCTGFCAQLQFNKAVADYERLPTNPPVYVPYYGRGYGYGVPPVYVR